MPRSSSYAGANRRITKPAPIWVVLSVLGIAGIAYATLCPIGLRPHLASANQERFGAYFVLGFLLALAARRRWAAVTAFVIVLAFGLEAAQSLAPGRHAVLADAVVKALGGLFGASAGQFVFPLRRLVVRLIMSLTTRASPPRAIDHGRDQAARVTRG